MNRKKFVIPGVIIISAILIFFTGKKYLIPLNIEPQNFKTSTVDYGPVAITVPATGVVNPKSEVLILSPATSIISKINAAPGRKVLKGDILLSLDPAGIKREIEALKDQLDIMENDLQKNKLNSRSTKVDLDYNQEVKNLKITSLKAEIADQEQLLKVGGISPAMFDQTKQELVLAEKDLKMVKEKNNIRLKQIESEEQGLLLQMDVKKKELEFKENLLGLMQIKAPSNGIVLDIYGNPGEKVDKDKLLIKMSDLSAFKIKGSVDNKYHDDLKTGGIIYAILDSVVLKGIIGNVSPVINDKKINFDVFLDDSHNHKLIPNLEIDIMIVTSEKDSVLRVKNGPAFNKNKLQEMFVMTNNNIVRKTVTTGIIGTDYIEILSGLNFGEKVITSEISVLRHRKEIEIR